MPLRPIDLQININQTTNVSKTKVQQNNAEQGQQHYSVQLDEKDALKKTQISETEHTSDKNVDEDGRHAGEHSEGKNRKNKEKEVEKEKKKIKASDGIRGKKIDITI